MEQRRLIKLKDGIKEMTCSEVFEQFKKFIYKTAYRFLNSGEDIDDLIQISNMGLVKAFNSYKIESENLFMTYLAIVVNNQVLMHLRRIKKFKNETSFDDPLCIDSDGNSLTLLEIIKDPKECEEIVFKKIADTELRNFINELDPRNKKVLELFYFDNINQNKIGEALNIRQSYVSRLIKKSLKILKTKYERNEYLMTKKEECFKIFAENLGISRGKVIDLVIEKVGVTQTTAQTYYPAWRNEYMGKPASKHEKVKNITETANKITKVAEKSPIMIVNTPIVESIPDVNIGKIVSDEFAKAKEKFHEDNEKIFAEAKESAAIRNEKLTIEVKEVINPKVEGINWKVDAINPVENPKVTEAAKEPEEKKFMKSQ